MNQRWREVCERKNKNEQRERKSKRMMKQRYTEKEMKERKCMNEEIICRQIDV